MKKSLIMLVTASLMLVGLAGCSTVTQDDEAGTADTAYYANTIFDTSYVHEINVEIAEEDWAELLENPTDKTKYPVDVTVDGTTVSNVSFATKGNTSLSSMANTDSDRYSFKINFGKYVDGQTYDGLDILNLNNAYADATYLKDYLSYRILAEAGADASLVSFVSLSINGETYGLYVAIEEVRDSFLARNYGDDAGELYKPETNWLNNIGGGEMPGGGQRPDGGAMPGGGGMPDLEAGEWPAMGDGERFVPDWDAGGEAADPPGMTGGNGMSGGRGGFGGPGGFGSASNGASLVYTDDELASYSDIFDNAETDVDEEDMERLIAALKQLGTGEELESCVDVEAVMRYFVGHNFVINYDSYTGNMLHNYYLYEEDGVLSMLPWDYNLAFGGFSNGPGSDASDLVNWPMDSPLDSNVNEEDRPMWSQLAANEAYLELYHTYFDELLTNYFESGRFADEIDSVYEMIHPYVESDPTSFYSLEEFDEAVATLKAFCLLRAESLRGQLEGAIPATAEGQQEDRSGFVDASDVTINTMGSMNMGRGSNDGGEGFPNRP